jgi:hypothetical protein
MILREQQERTFTPKEGAYPTDPEERAVFIMKQRLTIDLLREGLARRRLVKMEQARREGPSAQ